MSERPAAATISSVTWAGNVLLKLFS
jgi:hypothetical protein